MNILITPSSLKHNLTKNDVIYGYTNIIKSKRKYNKTYDYENIWALSLLQNGNNCEIIYFYKDIDTVVIIHAMSPARKSFIKEIERRNNDL